MVVCNPLEFYLFLPFSVKILRVTDIFSVTRDVLIIIKNINFTKIMPNC